MLSFESDYIQGAHEQILKRLAETNREPLSGYGNDKYCESAKEKIRQACALRRSGGVPEEKYAGAFSDVSQAERRAARERAASGRAV